MINLKETVCTRNEVKGIDGAGILTAPVPCLPGHSGRKKKAKLRGEIGLHLLN